MTKDTNRSPYTRRIMEIVANIKKQKEEINKVYFQFFVCYPSLPPLSLSLSLSLSPPSLSLPDFQILIDTKRVQKEINQLSGKLDRVFQITDEQVFKVTKPIPYRN